MGLRILGGPFLTRAWPWILLIVACLSAQMARYQFEYASEEGRLWWEEPALDTPLNVRAGAHTRGTLVVRAPAEYYVALVFERDGSDERLNDLVTSYGSSFKVRWSVAEDSRPLAHGDPGTPYGSAGSGTTFERNLAHVPLHPGRLYTIEVEIVASAPELANANPRLQVLRDPHPYKDYYVSASIAAHIGLVLTAAAVLSFGFAIAAWFGSTLLRLGARVTASVQALRGLWRNT